MSKSFHITTEGTFPLQSLGGSAISAVSFNSVGDGATVTLYDSPTDSGSEIAVITPSVPVSLLYGVELQHGLTVVVADAACDITVVLDSDIVIPGQGGITEIVSEDDSITIVSAEGPVVNLQIASEGGTALLKANDLSDVANAGASRANLHVQTLAAAVCVVTANVSTASPGTITADGVTPTSGQTVLLVGQTTASQNGPWVYNGSSAAMTRPTDYQDSIPVQSRIIGVIEGTQFGRTTWATFNVSSITVDETSTTWIRTNRGPFIAVCSSAAPAYQQGVADFVGVGTYAAGGDAAVLTEAIIAANALSAYVYAFGGPFYLETPLPLDYAGVDLRLDNASCFVVAQNFAGSSAVVKGSNATIDGTASGYTSPGSTQNSTFTGGTVIGQTSEVGTVTAATTDSTGTILTLTAANWETGALAGLAATTGDGITVYDKGGDLLLALGKAVLLGGTLTAGDTYTSITLGTGGLPFAVYDGQWVWLYISGTSFRVMVNHSGGYAAGTTTITVASFVSPYTFTSGTAVLAPSNIVCTTVPIFQYPKSVGTITAIGSTQVSCVFSTAVAESVNWSAGSNSKVGGMTYPPKVGKLLLDRSTTNSRNENIRWWGGLHQHWETGALTVNATLECTSGTAIEASGNLFTWESPSTGQLTTTAPSDTSLTFSTATTTGDYYLIFDSANYDHEIVYMETGNATPGGSTTVYRGMLGTTVKAQPADCAVYQISISTAAATNFNQKFFHQWSLGHGFVSDNFGGCTLIADEGSISQTSQTKLPWTLADSIRVGSLTLNRVIACHPYATGRCLNVHGFVVNANPNVQVVNCQLDQSFQNFSVVTSGGGVAFSNVSYVTEPYSSAYPAYVSSAQYTGTDVFPTNTSIPTGVVAEPPRGTRATNSAPTSATVNTALDATLSLGTAFQNTLPYDILLTVYLAVSSNTSLVLSLGVGTTSTPTQQTIVTGSTVTGILPIPIKIPAGQYAKLSASGTVTEAIVGQFVQAA